MSGTIEEFRQKQQARRRYKREQLKRRIIFFSLLILLLAIIVAAVVRRPFTSEPSPSTVPSEINVAELQLYPQPPVKNPDLLQAMKVTDGIRACYLTFDDGPTNSVTPRILDTLRRYQIRATFFTVGSLLDANPDIARRLWEEGHCIANHSYAHSYSKLYADPTSFMNEINKTFDLIQNISGKPLTNKIFRFPGGGFDSGYWGPTKQTYKQLLSENQISYCDWNALNGDSETSELLLPEQLLERVKKTTKAEDVVILMHDAAAKTTTADSLPAVLDYLIGQGFVFRGLDEI